jgi:peptidoglycan hydrolase-like protein with peptidoglycan-binding domain
LNIDVVIKEVTVVDLRILLVGALALGLTGCATTMGQNKSSVDQMQIKVADLEKKVEEKDSEIVDLKYQVKDLSSRAESQPSAAETGSPRSSNIDQSTSSKGIIKVSANPSDVQKALKNAGFYKGTVDGKLGQQTKKAIESFQRKHNLTADGVIGRRTWEELKVYLQ